MCKLFYLGSPDARLIESLALSSSDVPVTGERQAGPGDDVPVVLNESPDLLTSALWGLVPAWSRSPGFGRQLVNARSDCLTERPAYRSAFRSRRCLVVVDGFYERRRNRDGTRTLVRFSLESGEPMALAGLWEVWRSPGGDALRTCTVVTIAANEFVGRVHGRMPAVLLRDRQQEWLHETDPARLLAVLRAGGDAPLVCMDIPGGV